MSGGKYPGELSWGFHRHHSTLNVNNLPIGAGLIGMCAMHYMQSLDPLKSIILEELRSSLIFVTLNLYAISLIIRKNSQKYCKVVKPILLQPKVTIATN